jgi:hypothetical protein
VRGRLLSVSVLNELDPRKKEGVEESYALVIVERRTICMTKSALNSLSPMGAGEHIQFVSCIHDSSSSGTQDRKRKPGSRNVTRYGQ